MFDINDLLIVTPAPIGINSASDGTWDIFKEITQVKAIHHRLDIPSDTFTHIDRTIGIDTTCGADMAETLDTNQLRVTTGVNAKFTGWQLLSVQYTIEFHRKVFQLTLCVRISIGLVLWRRLPHTAGF